MQVRFCWARKWEFAIPVIFSGSQLLTIYFHISRICADPVAMLACVVWYLIGIMHQKQPKHMSSEILVGACDVLLGPQRLQRATCAMAPWRTNQIPSGHPMTEKQKPLKPAFGSPTLIFSMLHIV